MSAPHPLAVHQLRLTDPYDDPPERSQEEAFLRVQAGMRAKHPVEFGTLLTAAIRLAAARGEEGFTAGEVLAKAGGRDRYPRNLIGAVLGSLRSRHSLHVIGREKGDSPHGKGRWVNRFALNGDAICADPILPSFPALSNASTGGGP